MTLSPSARRGFTLLEILMVVLVIGIASAVMVPEAMNAVDGSHLRDSLEKVISLNRYARARALLDKRPYGLLYHADTLEVQLVALPPRRELPAGNAWIEPPSRLEGAREFGGGVSEVEPVRTASLHPTLRIRGVKGAQREGDSWFVVYTDSGMTDPHTVEVLDPDGKSIRVRVNGITGEIAIRE